LISNQQSLFSFERLISPLPIASDVLLLSYEPQEALSSSAKSKLVHVFLTKQSELLIVTSSETFGTVEVLLLKDRLHLKQDPLVLALTLTS